MKKQLLLTVAGAALLLFSCQTEERKEDKTFGEIALKESAEPIRPGVPGESPFWNGYSKRFIYAPAFEFSAVEKAAKYHFEAVSPEDSSRYTFESTVPYAPLTPVWEKIPVGRVELAVTGISEEGDSLGVAGKRSFYRAAPFNGIYHQPAMAYDSSAMLALDLLMKKDFVVYWLDHKAPHPRYNNYRFPAKIYTALIIGAVTHARLKEGAKEAETSIEIAKIVADNLMSISFEEGTAWEFFPPTYHGRHISKNPPARFKHMKLEANFTIMGVDAGHAYLDLYDYLGDEKYLEAAKRIADTYKKMQLPNGSWYQLVDYRTGEPNAPHIVIPTAMINYFDRLRNDYSVSGLEEMTKKALQWTMENPVRTFNWQGQFEDIRPREVYENQSREQACELAMYLFRNSKDDPEAMKLAEELVRFAEDQFVIWEKPMDFVVGPKTETREGYFSKNWITPCVQEQYVFWMPVGRTAGIMAMTFWEAYENTGKEMYLAKAKSIANAFTIVQEANNGDYPTFFTKYKMSHWLNSAVYPAKVMMQLEKNIRNAGKE